MREKDELYLPFATVLSRFANAKRPKEVDKGTILKHLEFVLCHWNYSHSEILGVSDVCHLEVSSEENGVFARLLVLFVFDLDFMQVITHGLYLGKLNFAIIALRQVLHKRVQRLLHESILQALVLPLLTEHVV